MFCDVTQFHKGYHIDWKSLNKCFKDNCAIVASVNVLVLHYIQYIYSKGSVESTGMSERFCWDRMFEPHETHTDTSFTVTRP